MKKVGQTLAKFVYTHTIAGVYINTAKTTLKFKSDFLQAVFKLQV